MNSGCSGMIKPQSTLQNAEFENREMNNSDANGFDITQILLLFPSVLNRTLTVRQGLKPLSKYSD